MSFKNDYIILALIVIVLSFVAVYVSKKEYNCKQKGGILYHGDCIKVEVIDVK